MLRDDLTNQSQSTLTVAVLGATGNLGGHYTQQALAAGHKLQALARSVTKLTIAEQSGVTAIQGDATSTDDVAQVVTGANVVVSCIGGNKHSQVMEVASKNILSAAAQQPHPPRCIFVSSIGLGGTSPLIGWILERIAGKPTWPDYEAADLRIRTERNVPVTLVRPYALTDKPGKGAYHATTKSRITFARPITRADAATFLLDATTNPYWDGPEGVQLTGA